MHAVKGGGRAGKPRTPDQTRFENRGIIRGLLRIAAGPS